MQGRSVDWFAQTFATRQEAAQALLAMFRKGETSMTPASSMAKTEPSVLETSAAKTAAKKMINNAEDLSGTWIWATKEEQGEKHPGIFAFEQTADHKLRGCSVIEAPLQQNEQNLRSVVTVLPAAGTVSRNKEGVVELALMVTDPRSGSAAESTAVLSPNGTALFGKTTQKVDGEKNGEHHSAKVSYDWVAAKFVPPAAAK